MCGINGFLNAPEFDFGAMNNLVGQMNDRLAHRGPDDEGIWLDPDHQLGLGHRRLSILDLSSAGHQPMRTPCGLTIVFNGEIYNFNDLYHLVSDFPFKSRSDTEMILALYKKYGQDCLQHLNGMFAFAIWDPDKKELFLARDRVGKKPLYFAEQGTSFSFSSELRSLLLLPWITPALDREALLDFLTFSFVPLPRTMFEGIRKLEPGHKLTVKSNGSVRHEQYWDVEFEQVENDEQVLCDRIREALETSVRYRMVSDVPVGAFLSGGVDSSAVVALMKREAHYPVKTFSIGFEGQPDYDELGYARNVAEQFGTEHHERVVSREDMMNFLPRVVDVFDEPMADPTSIPIYFLAEAAKEQGLKVIMNGDGPDELLLGYRNWMKYQRLYPKYRAYGTLPGFLRKGVAAMAARLASDSANTDIFYRAARGQELFWAGARGLRECNKNQFLDRAFLDEVNGHTSYDVIDAFRQTFDRARAKSAPQLGDADWMAYIGFKHLIPNFYTYRADRLCMAHGVEGRSPFLDYQFVNLALSIPAAMKTKGGEPKSILKKAMEPVLSQDILYRKKKGFCVPMQQWGTEVMADTIEEELPVFSDQYGVFDQAEIMRLVAAMRDGQTAYTATLWSVYFLLNWSNSWLRS